MAYILKNLAKIVPDSPPLILPRGGVQRLPYEIPDRFQNSFYLANASLYDSVNWFLHRAYELYFPSLRRQLQNLDDKKEMSIEESVDKLNDIINVLNDCNSITDVRFPIKRDSGRYEVVRGFKGFYGLATGSLPTLGGLRFDENLVRDHVKGFSVLTMYKNYLMGLNFPGSHGGIKINPKKYTDNELKSIVKQYSAELIQKGFCGGKNDIVHPDFNTSKREMNWISETYLELTGDIINTASCGKDMLNNGVTDFSNSSALGAFYAINFFLKQENLMEKINLNNGLKEKTFIIQGLGKTGKKLAQYLIDNGAICVGVKESDAFIYNSNGIDFKELLSYYEEHSSIKNFSMAKPEINDKIYEERCDLLIFAANHKSLICYVADKVKAKLIVEAADSPISPGSHKILSHSKMVIPDIYACAGCTIASALEYMQNLKQLNIPLNDMLRYGDRIYEDLSNEICINSKHKMAVASSNENVSSYKITNQFLENAIQKVMEKVGQEIVGTVEEFQLGHDIRSAAYIVALEKMYRKIYANQRFL